MSNERISSRRRFLAKTAMGIAASQWIIPAAFFEAATEPGPDPSLSSVPSTKKIMEPLKFIDAGVLKIAYYETGPADGPVAMLMHGFPYDIHSYAAVAPLLAAKGIRVIIPYLRGHAPTTFIDAATMRSGEQAAIGMDLILLMDALQIKKAVLAGYDWGGRAACVAAALFPERCTGLVCVNSYLIQDIKNAGEPVSPDKEAPLWYQYYFHQERGRKGLEKYRKEIARILWTQWSPNWKFTDADLDNAAKAFDSPDYVDIVIHSYRHRFGLVPGDPRYAAIQQKLAALPPVTVPAITLDGAGDGVVPATDGSSTARFFKGKRTHQVIPLVGHNLPQEAPDAFADAVAKLLGR
jgi:pimeloyl-ACP methyl ester carboxylesterase